VIEPGSSAIARLENESHRIEVYHDQQGNLRFHEGLEGIEAETPFFKRYQDVLETHVDLMRAFLNRGAGMTLYSGRPDIVVEVYEKRADTKLPTSVLLGEIKYTESEQTFASGLKELLEYTRFARIGDVYLQETPEVDVGGLLITDGVKTDEVDGTVRHVRAGQLMERDGRLAEILEQEVPEADVE
jgi:hypothetical protein